MKDLTAELFEMGAAMNRALAEQVPRINAETLLGNRPLGVTPGLTIAEAIAALDLHAARALKRGDAGCAADLVAVRELIRSVE